MVQACERVLNGEVSHVKSNEDGARLEARPAE
jgi:hypothetical protein